MNVLLYRFGIKKRTHSSRSRQEVADSIPVRNKLVEWRREETGEVSLIIPANQKRHLRLLIRLMDLPDKRVVALDEVGSYVWEHCDGETSFGELIVELTRQFQMTPREAEASLTEYFKILGRRGMLGFLVSNEAAKGVSQVARRSSGRSSGSKRNAKRRRGR
jgi:hypothetical protein